MKRKNHIDYSSIPSHKEWLESRELIIAGFPIINESRQLIPEAEIRAQFPDYMLEGRTT